MLCGTRGSTAEEGFLGVEVTLGILPSGLPLAQRGVTKVPCFKHSCSMAHAFMDRWSQEAREGGTCRYPEQPWHGPGGCGFRLCCVCLPLTLSHSYSALSWGYASVPGPPSTPPRGSSFCHGSLGVTCPSILTLSSAPGPRAIRSSRPRRWP